MPEPGTTGVAGEGESFSNTTLLTANISDHTFPFEEQGSSNGAVATRGIVKGIIKFINKDNTKAMVSMGESWRVYTGTATVQQQL